MTTPLVAFPGFRPAAFAFFRGLSQHNDPAWFRPKKTIYEAEVLAPLRQLVVAVGAALGATTVMLTVAPPPDCPSRAL